MYKLLLPVVIPWGNSHYWPTIIWMKGCKENYSLSTTFRGFSQEYKLILFHESCCSFKVIEKIRCNLHVIWDKNKFSIIFTIFWTEKLWTVQTRNGPHDHSATQTQTNIHKTQLSKKYSWNSTGTGRILSWTRWFTTNLSLRAGSFSKQDLHQPFDINISLFIVPEIILHKLTWDLN